VNSRITSLGALLALACLAVTAVAQERILDYRSDIQVQPDGRLKISELIRVRAEGVNIRRGIFRDFPTRYRDRAGNLVNVEFNPLSVRRNGSSEAWHSTKRPNGVRLYAGSPGRTIEPGIHEYELIFVTNRQLGFFESHDELYFNAIGHGWNFSIDHAVVTVTLPFDVPAGQLALDVYTGRFGTNGSDATAEVIGGNQVRYETTRVLAPREGLTIAAAWPKGLLAEPGMTRKIAWFLTDNGAAVVLLAGFLLAFGWYLWAWNAVGRDPGQGVIIPRFEPPAGLSPAACRYVASMSFNRDAFTAAVISLAVKGQLVIEEDGDEFTLQRLADPRPETLTNGESAVLEALLPLPSSRIELEPANHSNFQAARSALKKELKKEYLGRLFHLNGLYIVPPAAFSVAAAIIAIFLDGGPAVWISYVVLSLALHGLFAFLMRAPTTAGRLIMDEIEGFKMYLGTAEQDRLDRMRSPALTPEVFETFLPYAYALDVENDWCEWFSREIPEDTGKKAVYSPLWYSGQVRGMNALNHLGDSFSSSFSSAISSASSPPGSSSGSGGGGFSGGGGGGGGGGGW
jgi:uncharacterized membrane protein YgcG